jgi:hypothetical protein
MELRSSGHAVSKLIYIVTQLFWVLAENKCVLTEVNGWLIRVRVTNAYRGRRVVTPLILSSTLDGSE